MDNENNAPDFEYFDEEFYDMELDEQIVYLKENPDKAIYPDDVEDDYFWDLSQALTEAGEDELAFKILELYYNATLEAQRECYAPWWAWGPYGRTRPIRAYAPIQSRRSHDRI
jgi:hypothetical protein